MLVSKPRQAAAITAITAITPAKAMKAAFVASYGIAADLLPEVYNKPLLLAEEVTQV
jgi:hypothetical protein